MRPILKTRESSQRHRLEDSFSVTLDPWVPSYLQWRQWRLSLFYSLLSLWCGYYHHVVERTAPAKGRQKGPTATGEGLGLNISVCEQMVWQIIDKWKWETLEIIVAFIHTCRGGGLNVVVCDASWDSRNSRDVVKTKMCLFLKIWIWVLKCLVTEDSFYSPLEAGTLQ